MKTTNYKVDLLVPFAAGKEVYFNTAISVFDHLMNNSLLAEVEHLPEDADEGALYLYNCSIALYLNASWKLIDPKEGMIFFRFDLEKFTFYKNGKWNLC